MDLSLLAIIVVCVLYAAALYYFVFGRREPELGGLASSGIVNLLFVIVPIVVMVLWIQSGAEKRLAELGLTPFPGFVASSGVAAGTGESPIWVFSTDEDSDSVLDFYASEEHRSGWDLTQRGETTLVLQRDGQTLTLFAGDGDVVLTLQTRQ